MKKSIFTIASFLAFSFFAAAQETPRTVESEENAIDKMEQQNQPPTQTQTERNAKITTERETREKETIETEKKQKSNEAVKEKSKTVEKTKTVEKKSANPKK